MRDTVVVLTINASGLALLEMLKSFKSIGRDVSLSEFARLVGRPKQTVHRALATLVEAGFVVQNETSGRYALGSEILSLSSVIMRQLDVRQVAEPTLRGLAHTTGESVTLAIRHNDEIVFIDRYDGNRGIRFYCDIGRRLPLHVGAAAKAFLGALDENSFEDYISSIRTTEGAAVDPAVLQEARLQRGLTRSRGYSFSDEEVDEGVSGIGAAILDHFGRPVAGFAVATLTQFLTSSNVEILRPHIINAAKAISAQLGFWPDVPTDTVGTTSGLRK